MEESHTLMDVIFLVVTGAVAWHALTRKDDENGAHWVRLLFGSIALLFFMRVLFVDLLKLI